MLIVQKRCKHCGKTYGHQLSGNGDYTYNDANYCPDCKKVMLDALKNVPVKFEPSWKEIPVNITNNLASLKERVLSERKEIQEYGGILMRKAYPIVYNSSIKEAEIWTIKGVRYVLKHFRDGTDKMFVLCEKSVKENQFGEVWNNGERDEYDKIVYPEYDCNAVIGRQMDKPDGKCMYIDIIKE